MPIEKSRNDLCPTRHLLQRLSDKWTLSIITILFEGEHQYGELERKIPGISRRMLTRTLRQCIHAGLVYRCEYFTKPMTVRYSLTPLGTSLQEPLAALAVWSTDYGKRFEDSYSQQGKILPSAH